jgi:hypothetical protein
MLYTHEKMKDVATFLYCNDPSNFAHKSDNYSLGVFVAGKR